MRQVRWMVFAAAALAVGAMAGCKSMNPLGVSAGGPVMKNVKVIGRSEGFSTARYYLMGLVGPIGDDSLEAAMTDALSKKGGDSLINVTVDREQFNVLGLMIESRTRVTGLAIKYQG